MDIKTKKELLKNRLSDSRKELFQVINQLSDEQLDQRVTPHKDSWTVIEVVKHLNSAEKGMLQLMSNIKKGSEGVPADFDLNRYNRRQVEKQAELDKDAVIKAMKNNRDQLLEFLASLEDGDFAKKGRHATLRIMTIEEIINLIANHELGHVDKIKKSLFSES